MKNIKELKSEKLQRSACPGFFWVMHNMGTKVDHKGADFAKYAS